MYCINVCLVHGLFLSLLFIVSTHLSAVVRSDAILVLTTRHLYHWASACINHLSKYMPVLHSLTMWKVSPNFREIDWLMECLEQWFLTFSVRWNPLIINGLHGPLSHQTYLKGCWSFQVDIYFTFITSIDTLDPLHGPLGDPCTYGWELMA